MSCKSARWRELKSLLNNLEAREFWALFERTPGAVVLDVRTGKELEEGALPDALHLDFLAPDFWEKLEALDKEKTYFVYCRSGRRSLRVCTYMRNGGFKNIFNLDNGLKESF
jgi:rhodanese-related sulfurtransferase